MRGTDETQVGININVFTRFFTKFFRKLTVERKNGCRLRVQPRMQQDKKLAYAKHQLMQHVLNALVFFSVSH